MTRYSLVVAPLVEADAPPLLQQRGETLQRLRQGHVHLADKTNRLLSYNTLSINYNYMLISTYCSGQCSGSVTLTNGSGSDSFPQ
jgi:hypothetical protein